MFSKLFKRSHSHEIPQELFASIVAQARRPGFFTHYGFQDTVTGRFDCLSLHLFLFSRRLVREDSPFAQSLNQEVFDIFTADTDRALRELGIGDTSVPKRKKKMIRTFYALVDEYGVLLDEGNKSGIISQLQARFGKEQSDNGFECEALADYMMASAQKLDEVPSDRIMAGKLDWPDPAKFLLTCN